MSVHLNNNFIQRNTNRPSLKIVLNSYDDIKVNLNDYNPIILNKNKNKNKNRERVSLYFSNSTNNYEYDFNKWLHMYNNVLYNMYELFILPYKNENCGIFDKVKYGRFCYFMYQNSSLLKDKYV